MIIAIDGPAASGKGTLGKRLVLLVVEMIRSFVVRREDDAVDPERGDVQCATHLPEPRPVPERDGSRRLAADAERLGPGALDDVLTAAPASHALLQPRRRFLHLEFPKGSRRR